MVDHSPIKFDKEIELGYTTSLEDTSTQGWCVPEYTLDGKSVLIEDVDAKDLNRLILQKTSSILNLSWLQDEIADIAWLVETESEKLRNMGEMAETEIVEQVAKYQKKHLERLAIKAQIRMVEEVAHAFYIHSAANNPRKLQRLSEDMKLFGKPDPVTGRSGATVQNYLGTQIETSARFWQESFLGKLYPNSKEISKVQGEINMIKQYRQQKQADTDPGT